MNLTGKRLLILGAGRGQKGLYQAARRMGVHTIAGTLPDHHPPCIPLADEVCYMNIARPEEVVEKASGLGLDGVATCCLDTGVPALGAVCDALGLRGLTGEAASLCADKLRMKRALAGHGVSTARFAEIYGPGDLEAAIPRIGLPAVLKATDLQGSSGIYICHSIEEVKEAYRQVGEQSRRGYCLLEEYIEGEEFGAQAFICDGGLFFVMPHGDETVMSHTAVPVGHYVPLGIGREMLLQTEDIVEKAVRAIGLDNCAVNVDLIARDGVVYVIELTGRIGANCLPELVEINFGIEYYKMTVAMALGEDPRVFWSGRARECRAGIARMILEQERGGILRSISWEGEPGPMVREVTFFKHPGDEIRVFESSNDCIGQIIVQGETLDACRKQMETVRGQIRIELE